MRLRFRSISYTVGGPSASLERHYRELRESMLRAGAHYGLQSASPWRPPIDIHETPTAILVKMELAGVGEDDIEITLYDNAVVVSGQRMNDILHDVPVYYHEAQVRYGPFRADILLPFPVDSDAVEATYDHGFLRVRLPKVSRTATDGDGSEGSSTQTSSDADPSETAAPASEESSPSAVNRQASAQSEGTVSNARARNSSGVHASRAPRRSS